MILTVEQVGFADLFSAAGFVDISFISFISFITKEKDLITNQVLIITVYYSIILLTVVIAPE